ncbi:MAG: nucleoside-triphosphatase [Candidatus Nitrosocaldus sp.]
MLILLTGEPGIGKSTVLLRLVELLKEEGMSVGGVVAKEVRDDASKRRIGFEFIDVTDGSRARLASIGIDGPRIGRYGVDLDGCKAAATMLLRSMDCNKVIVFDEIGPMELLSPDIVESLRYLLDVYSGSSRRRREDTIVLAVIHKRFRHWIISKYKERASMIIEVNEENRGSLPEMLLDAIKKKDKR